MRVKPQPRRVFMLGVALALAVVIFAIDTLSPLDMAIAVLYAVVVLFLTNEVERRTLLLVGAACVGLTMLSFTIMHRENYNLASVMRCIVSIAAISVTTLLSLKNQKATRALREQADLLDLSHDAVFVRGDSDIITYWNQGAERLYGWPRAEAVGRKASQLLHTVFPESPLEIREAVHRAGRWEGELSHTRRDGTPVVVMSRWSLQRDARGRPIATMETNSDITQRKRAEDGLHQAQAELAHVTRVATMGELTASIAHEINQPLAAVVTNGEACLRWLGRDVPDLGEAKSAVEQMIRNGRRASEVVARLRALARRGEPLRLPVDINEATGEALLLLERELSNHRVALDLSLDPKGPHVLGDRVQLQQVLINLALNAIQAMDAVPEARRCLHLETSTRDEAGQRRVLIKITDTGPGVDPQNLPLLFNAFYSTKSDGMGMGLSISRSIIEAHNGLVSATLVEGGGMCFSVTLSEHEEPSS
ncbi:sensor histidine kinase [Xanthobacter dioxanivorans]|uniref:sensor histidine kinase n=1 Tax=Xanthobacter dioxanivorans TaxID=2528964 RepID=UPI001E30B35B|nr:ATP-binding protein [Xanthobacter dioxanivorans]